ncbi:MAG: GyrI-like domain-containing protein [Pseudolabrys sp.]
MPRLLLASVVVLATFACPALAQNPPAPPPGGTLHTPTPLQPGDPFGEEITLPERTIVFFKGSGIWVNAFDTLAAAFKALNQYVDSQGIKPTGKAMTIYTRTDDKGFDFQAALPVAEPPKDLPKGDIAAGPAPAGKAMKFTHRGSFDALDMTYEAITNHLDGKRLEARDMFIEEYAGDAMKNAEDQLVVTIIVPLR